MSSRLPDTDPAKVVLLSGCTASGKSALALDLAERQGREVVNADALQVYDGWRILTARPSDDELLRAPHRLYGHVGHRRAYSVGDWLRDVAPLLARRPAPVIVGGTGLYFQAMLKGLADIPATDPGVRAEANARLAADGLEAMVAELDPQTAGRIDLRNPARVQRAWEVRRQTGRGLASWQDETGPALLPAGEAAFFRVEIGRDTLNARIDRRFDAMLEAGGWDEARRMEPGWDPDLQSSRAIGAPELIAAIRGMMPEAEAVDAAKLATRQYAKRQRTWMRSKMAGWEPIPAKN
ncbi:tRNA (adenosine(37)-N6)-dimethylallyltransferase MiaA [Poseidonocella sp. HB161398]|uniref:tRNA (adenosine(37)-N6)-dimethylallyltransferase MiaA n=1 Tax=Poseidonocella sp. HB161398 TaxID=2320855 RepID=UPI001108CD7C|nr:tRNA (adenosine(37)-N6)-dimethylallyltransferase MiaA [Poseidonocella sp. HB161398]